MGDEQRSPKVELTAWITASIEGQNIVDLPKLATDAFEHFRQDQAFITALMDQMLRPMIYDIAKRAMKQTRPPGDVVELGDKLMSKAEFKKHSKRASERWRGWMEHVGDKHVNLMAMTKPDLLTAAKERRDRGDVEYAYADLWDALALRLEGQEKVGERFSIEEIERVRVSLVNGEKVAA